jgi:hypothetical protein
VAGLNVDYVREVDWWEHADFADRDMLHAAELIAFDVLNPALRSLGAERETAKTLAADRGRRALMEPLFRAAPAGRLTLPSLAALAVRVGELEQKLRRLEQAGDGG